MAKTLIENFLVIKVLVNNTNSRDINEKLLIKGNW